MLQVVVRAYFGKRSNVNGRARTTQNASDHRFTKRLSAA